MPMVSYECSCCGCREEHFYHRDAEAPATQGSCRSVDIVEVDAPTVEHRIANADGTETIELEQVETVPQLKVCTGTLSKRDSWLDSTWSRPARPFEPLVIYQHPTDPAKVSIPGRNYEPTDPGYKRVEITSMQQYNQVAKQINNALRSQMSDHREMHKEYWGARRKAMRDHVNARIRPEPQLVSLARLIRSRSDNKTNRRYGKPLEPNFHAQLLEFNQGNMQDYCDADTKWKATRAK